MLLIYQNQTKKSSSKKYYSPYTYDEKLLYYKAINRNARGSYYYFANKYRKMYKLHIVFTKVEDVDKYKKLEDVIVIRECFFKKLQNLTLHDAYYFSNIELGKNLDNPHLDIQLWINKKDVKRIERAYNKTIQKYDLESGFCTFNGHDKNISNVEIFNYTIKEYSKELSKHEIYALGEARKDYRKKLGKKNLKFFTNSRKSYSKRIYTKSYLMFNFSREKTEYLLDNRILLIRNKTQLILNIDFYIIWTIRQLIYIVNKFLKNYKYHVKYTFIDKGEEKKYFYWCYWLFGFI